MTKRAVKKGKLKIGDSYDLHYTVSGFSALFFDLAHHPKAYGAVDYVVLWENGVASGYLSEKGKRQSYRLSEKLLSSSFFNELIDDSQKISKNLKTYSVPEINDENAVREWKKYVKLHDEFSRVYRFYEQPFQQALEKAVLSKISEGELVDFLSRNVKTVPKSSQLYEIESHSLEKLLKLGKVKLELHQNASNMVTRDIKKFFEFVFHKRNVPMEILQTLRKEEFLRLLKGERISMDEAKRRLSGFALIKEDGIWKMESGRKFISWKKKIQGAKNQEIVGKVAYPGKVIGKVVLHLSWTDTTEIEEGDILVAGMTNPQMIPYIKKAGAIVTDEGGITCHAAIISREMKKPCITGAKIATKVLKDGDLVEVDAENGMVRIIKK